MYVFKTSFQWIPWHFTAILNTSPQIYGTLRDGRRRGTLLYIKGQYTV
jgi:hypothetical protein